jgi:hypothetical protein
MTSWVCLTEAMALPAGPAAAQPQHGREERSRGDHTGPALRQAAQPGQQFPKRLGGIVVF